MKRISFALVASGLFFAVTQQSQAGIAHSVADAAPVIGEGEYSGRLIGDISLSGGGGLTITPRFKTGIYDQYVDITAVLGAGTDGWQLGAVAKYNLLPDIAGQVGLSFLGSVHVIDDVKTAFQIGVGAVVSEKLQASFGEVTPYGSLELDAFLTSGASTVPVHLNFGAIWEPMSTGPWSFVSEFQIGLARGHYVLALGTAYRF